MNYTGTKSLKKSNFRNNVFPKTTLKMHKKLMIILQKKVIPLSSADRDLLKHNEIISINIQISTYKTKTKNTLKLLFSI